MISAIIFSKDRATQLRLLLESMFLNSYKLFDKIMVIYRASSETFAQGYKKLQEENILPVSITWVSEYNLVQDVSKAMTEAQKGQNTFTVFLTDDSVFYRNVHEYKFPIESSLHRGSDIACFSLRLGTNTTQQQYWQPGSDIQLVHTKIGNIIKWRHVDYAPHLSYGYPLSVDGHVFRADEIFNFVQRLGDFKSVNGLEGNLTKFKFELAPCMASFEQSALITVPINRVQNDAPNNAGMFHGISPEELNQRYLQGEVIDYYSIDFSSICGTHQELAYKFKRQ